MWHFLTLWFWMIVAWECGRAAQRLDLGITWKQARAFVKFRRLNRNRKTLIVQVDGVPKKSA